MQFGQSGIGGLSQSTDPHQLLTNASAALGFGSTANSWASTAGLGPDLNVNTFGFATFHKDGSWPTREDLLGSQSSTSNGWFWNLGSGSLSLFWRGASGGFGTLSGDLLHGLHCIAWTRTAGGAIRACIDGGGVVQLSAAPTYTTAGASAVQHCLYNLPEVTGACTATRIINFGDGGAALSDAELQTMSGNVNTRYRWDFPPSAVAHASLISGHQAKDWDGSSSTWVASIGSAPRTLTKRGTGGGKTDLPRMQRVKLEREHWLDNELWFSQSTPVDHNVQSMFAQCEFSHSATRMWVEGISTAGSSFVRQGDVGMSVDGTQVTTQRNSTGSGLEFFPLDTMLIRDCVDQSAASHNYIMCSGLQSHANTTSSPLRGNFAQAIWVPVGTTVTFVPYAPPARRYLLNLTDSTAVQVSDTNTLITTPCTQAWVMRVRAALLALGMGWRVTVKGWGGRTFGLYGDTAGGRQTMATDAAALLDGTTINVSHTLIGHNDKELGAYTNIVTFKSDFRDWASKFDAATVGKPGLTKRIISPYWGSADTVPNGGGAGITVTQIRTAESEVASELGWLYTDGNPIVTATTGFGDGVHLRAGNPGHQQAADTIILLPELV